MKTPPEIIKLLNDQTLLKKKQVFMQSNRDKVIESAVYHFDTCLKRVGCDRNHYHKQSIDGNKGRILIERREEFGAILFDDMKECLKISKENRNKMLEGRVDTVGLATDDEIKKRNRISSQDTTLT